MSPIMRFCKNWGIYFCYFAKSKFKPQWYALCYLFPYLFFRRHSGAYQCLAQPTTHHNNKSKVEHIECQWLFANMLCCVTHSEINRFPPVLRSRHIPKHNACISLAAQSHPMGPIPITNRCSMECPRAPALFLDDALTACTMGWQQSTGSWHANRHPARYTQPENNNLPAQVVQLQGVRQGCRCTYPENNNLQTPAVQLQGVRQGRCLIWRCRHAQTQ